MVLVGHALPNVTLRGTSLNSNSKFFRSVLKAVLLKENKESDRPG